MRQLRQFKLLIWLDFVRRAACVRQLQQYAHWTTHQSVHVVCFDLRCADRWRWTGRRDHLVSVWVMATPHDVHWLGLYPYIEVCHMLFDLVPHGHVHVAVSFPDLHSTYYHLWIPKMATSPEGHGTRRKRVCCIVCCCCEHHHDRRVLTAQDRCPVLQIAYCLNERH